MTQPNDDYQLSDSPPRNEYQLSDTDRINYLESSVASFNHMVVLLNERLDALEAARLAAEMPPNVESDLHRRIQNVDSSHNLLVSQVEAVRKHQKDHYDTVTAEIYDLHFKVQKLNDEFVEFMSHGRDPSPVNPRGPGNAGAQVVTGPLPSHSYMDQIKKSLKIIEKECDILKHLWRQP